MISCEILGRPGFLQFSRQAFDFGGQPDPPWVIQQDAFVFLLLFLQNSDLLFEVVEGLPELFVNAVSQACHECKPEVLFHGPDRLIDQGVAGKRFRRMAA